MLLFSGRWAGNLLERSLDELTHELCLAAVLTPNHRRRERFAICGHCVDIARSRVHGDKGVAHLPCESQVNQVSKCQLWVCIETFQPEANPVLNGDSLVLKLFLLEVGFVLNLPGTLEGTRSEDALNAALVEDSLVGVIVVQLAQKLNRVLLQFKTASIRQLGVVDGLVVPQTLLDLQVVLIAEVPQNAPANFHLAFANENFHQDFETLKVDSFKRGRFVKVVSLSN